MNKLLIFIISKEKDLYIDLKTSSNAKITSLKKNNKEYNSFLLILYNSKSRLCNLYFIAINFRSPLKPKMNILWVA